MELQNPEQKTSPDGFSTCLAPMFWSRKRPGNSISKHDKSPNDVIEQSSKGWLSRNKRKLVNMNVLDSMRRIVVQETNRKDREINGLKEQLEEDAKIIEALHLQLMGERSKCVDVKRENSSLQIQVSMLLHMLKVSQGFEQQDTHDS